MDIRDKPMRNKQTAASWAVKHLGRGLRRDGEELAAGRSWQRDKMQQYSWHEREPLPILAIHECLVITHSFGDKNQICDDMFYKAC